MTTTTHAACSHPTTKSARAKCRREGGAAYAKAMQARSTATVEDCLHALAGVNMPTPGSQDFSPVKVYEPCCCKGAPEGFHELGDGVWVCVTCDRPTRQYLMNALGQTLVAA